MKKICILSCVLLVGALDSAKASASVKSSSRSGVIPFSVDAFATDSNNDEEPAYSSSLIGAQEDDYSVDAKKKKKKKKKKKTTHAS